MGLTCPLFASVYAFMVVCERNALLKEGNQNDRVDARKLAELLENNQLRPVYQRRPWPQGSEGVGAQLSNLDTIDAVNESERILAGLWDAWKDSANGQWLQSYTITTTDANELIAPVHDRIPAVLHPETSTAGSTAIPTPHALRSTFSASSPPTRWKPSRSAPM